MDFSQLVNSLTPEMVEQFSKAVETGKWADGNVLSDQQKASCMQAIMLFKARFEEDSEEPFTIDSSGELRTGQKVRSDYANEKPAIDPTLIIKSTKQ